MVTFKIVPHAMLRDKQVVEVWVDEFMVAAVYAEPPNKIRVFSNHLHSYLNTEDGDKPAIFEFVFEKK